jgi:hypothetical protein
MDSLINCIHSLTLTLSRAHARRRGKQISERWYNELDPAKRKDPWTPEEDERLVRAYQA